MEWLQGLFSGSPYAGYIDPQQNQGLMGGALRNLGIGLLANSQNPNYGEGLAKAMLLAQQHYGQGAESLYNVGLQRERSALDREYREGIIADRDRAREIDAEKVAALRKKAEGEAADAEKESKRLQEIAAGIADPVKRQQFILAASGKHQATKFLGPDEPEQPRYFQSGNQLISIIPGEKPVVEYVFPEKTKDTGGKSFDERLSEYILKRIPELAKGQGTTPGLGPAEARNKARDEFMLANGGSLPVDTTLNPSGNVRVVHPRGDSNASGTPTTPPPAKDVVDQARALGDEKMKQFIDTARKTYTDEQIADFLVGIGG